MRLHPSITTMIVIGCFVLGWVFPPTRESDDSRVMPVASPPTLMGDRSSPSSNWMDRLDELFSTWEPTTTDEAFLTLFQTIQTQPLPVRNPALGRLVAEWGESSPAGLLSRAFKEKGYFLGLTLQFFFHQNPEAVLPYLSTILEENDPGHWLWLSRAARGDRNRMRELIDHHELANFFPEIEIYHDPAAALEAAMKTQNKALIYEIFEIWNHRDPEEAWNGAEKTLAGHRYGRVFERCFFAWVRRDIESAFANRERIANTLVNTDLGEVRNAQYIHQVIGGQWMEQDPEKAIAAALTLEKNGPLESFLYGVRRIGMVEAQAFEPLLLRAQGSRVFDNLIHYMKERFDESDFQNSKNLDPISREALSKAFQ